LPPAASARTLGQPLPRTSITDKPKPQRKRAAPEGDAAAAKTGTTAGLRALADPDLLRRVAEHKDVFFKVGGGVYQSVKPGSFRLVPPEEVLGAVRSDYGRMREMVFDDPMPFNDLVTGLRAQDDQVGSDDGWLVYRYEADDAGPRALRRRNFRGMALECNSSAGKQETFAECHVQPNTFAASTPGEVDGGLEVEFQRRPQLSPRAPPSPVPPDFSPLASLTHRGSSHTSHAPR